MGAKVCKTVDLAPLRVRSAADGLAKQSSGLQVDIAMLIWIAYAIGELLLSQVGYRSQFYHVGGQEFWFMVVLMDDISPTVITRFGHPLPSLETGRMRIETHKRRYLEPAPL